jgi:phytanoyl-CoA hydroxylase
LETNGALYFLPGSHLISPITKRFIRLPDKKGTGFEPLPHNPNSKESSTSTNSSNDDYVLVTCKPGPFLSFLLFCAVNIFLFFSFP